jgi:hypothetical protein
MILPLLILAAQVPTAPRGTVPPPGSGSELMVQCVATLGIALGAGSGDTVAKGALCMSYVEGFADDAKSDVCLPPQPVMPVIHSYLQFMKDNPKYYEMPKAVGLRAAIDAAYPCRK